MKKELLSLIMVGLAYSIAVFAYTHTTFVSKDVLSIVLTQLERIENKLDAIGGR